MESVTTSDDVSTHENMSSPADYRSVPLEIRQQLYRPLKSWQTRILRIHASTEFTSPVECDLLTAGLIAIPGLVLIDEDEVIEYEALSYSWGCQTLTHSIICNQLSFLVGKALHDALRHLRKPDSSRFLWCDACCIDQANLVEKAEQVQKMFTIFEKASRVIAWLGLPSAETPFLFQLIHDNSRDRAAQKSSYVHEGGRKASNKDADVWLENEPFSERARRAAVQCITESPYFKRCWIRQEMEATRNLLMVYGQYSSSFADFTRSISFLLLESESPREELLRTACADEQTWLRYIFFRDCQKRNSKSRAFDNWFQNIMRGSIYDATLPQDKVFSMLNLATRLTEDERGDPLEIEGTPSNATNGFPAVDYEKPVSLVFQDFIKHTIKLGKSLECLAIFQDRSVNGTDLPSWAMDLRVNSPRYQLLDRHRPAKYLHSYRHVRPKWSEQNFDHHGALLVHGEKLGTVTPIEPVTLDQCGPTWPESWVEDWPFTSPVLRKSYHEYRDCLAFKRLNRKAKSIQVEYEAMEDMPQHEPFFSGLDEFPGLVRNKCNYRWQQILMGQRLSSTFRCLSQVLQHCTPDPAPTHAIIYALVSALARDGDVLAMFKGTHNLFVLRPMTGNHYSFLGPALCYVGVWSLEQPVGNESKLDLFAETDETARLRRKKGLGHRLKFGGFPFEKASYAATHRFTEELLLV
ncbi:hypothetical protein H2200_000748 [Cladophialophora chaetospira]|uniref:Heterokaryon incompatibility domain-containing protein n=1 Tax=Cladophialophora chaetospira TaxID=386627 RepID=A0AA38XP50_9EURO|nr:hypothetical protein H2200_000748 [Cladophialophora chaetospira]